MINAANPQLDDDFDIPLNISQTTYGTGPSTKLITLPHVLCTGFSIGGILETCFPVGCICAKGAGICDMASSKITIMTTHSNKFRRWFTCYKLCIYLLILECIRKTTFFNINFNKDLIKAQPGQA